MRKIVLAAEAAAKAVAQGGVLEPPTSSPRTKPMTDPLMPCPLAWEQHTRQPYVADGLISARGTACEFAVHCPDCDISTPQFATAAEAVACWNQRAPKALAAEGADPETEWARILYRADYDGQGKLTQPNWPNPDTWDLSGALGHQYRRQARAILAALSAITDPTLAREEGSLAFDKQSDVLYTSLFNPPRPAVCTETSMVVLVRHDPASGEVVGMTVMDFLGQAARALASKEQG